MTSLAMILILMISTATRTVGSEVPDQLHKPSISVKPDYRVFVTGESVEISCSAEGSVQSFILRRDSETVTSQQVPVNSTTVTFTVSEIRPGGYSCLYYTRKQGGGGLSTSPPSDAVTISVRDPPQKPTISLSPDSRVFVRGESVQISCSAQSPGNKFSLYRDGEIVTSQTAPGHVTTATFPPLVIRAGNYSCHYTIRIDGRDYTTESERVGVSVWDAPQKPTISLRPDFRVFVRGESAEISCSGQYPGSKFSLYRDGEIVTSQTAPGQGTTVTFPPLVIRAGAYSCHYTTLIAGRNYTTESERVGVSVWDPPTDPTISLRPDHRVFVRGESAEISCSAQSLGSEFALYRDGEIVASQTVPEKTNTATFPPSEIRAGNYSCQYTTHIKGRNFTSKSERVGVSVREPPQKATISLRPDSRVFVRGESAEILCSGNYPGSEFTLYRDGEIVTSQTAPGQGTTATFPPSEIRAGNYSCQYTTLIAGRDYTSSESERVGVSVCDPLQKPSISLIDSVTGESSEISCSGNYPGSKFSLYKDDQMIKSQTAPGNNNSTAFTSLEISAGLYWCQYTIHIQGQDLTSPESERVKQAPTSTVGIRTVWVVTGIVILIVAIVLILVTVLLVRARKRRRRRDSSDMSSGINLQASNITYASVVRRPQPQAAQDDDDVIYANLNLANAPKARRKAGPDDFSVYASVKARV